MEIKQLIKELNKLTKAEAEKIAYYFNHGGQFSSDLFDEPIRLDDSLHNLKSLWGRRGVYLFKAIEDIELDNSAVGKWNRINGASFVWWKPQPLTIGDCFYIGKSDKSLYSRIKQHYSAERNGTSALLLGHQNRIIMRDKLECIAFPVKRIYTKDEYKMLLKAVESHLQQNLKQKCGVKN